MVLYTKKGDDGSTGVIGDEKRMSKSSALSEALGTLDELNSFLGLCKVEAEKTDFDTDGVSFGKIVHDVQRDLFIIGAELAGADKTITKEKVEELEKVTDSIEKQLLPIKTFFISGGTELASRFDVARTLARRTERKAIVVCEREECVLGKHTRAYLNRLSSILYAFARLSNHKSGITEEPPDYQ